MTWWVVRSKGGKLLPFQVRMGIILPGLPETGDDLDCCLSRVTGKSPANATLDQLPCCPVWILSVASCQTALQACSCSRQLPHSLLSCATMAGGCLQAANKHATAAMPEGAPPAALLEVTVQGAFLPLCQAAHCLMVSKFSMLHIVQERSRGTRHVWISWLNGAALLAWWARLPREALSPTLISSGLRSVCTRQVCALQGLCNQNRNTGTKGQRPEVESRWCTVLVVSACLAEANSVCIGGQMDTTVLNNTGNMLIRPKTCV